MGRPMACPFLLAIPDFQLVQVQLGIKLAIVVAYCKKLINENKHTAHSKEFSIFQASGQT